MKTTPLTHRPHVTLKPADEQQWLALHHVRSLQMATPAITGKLPHINSASGLVKVGERLLIVGDDDLSLAMFSNTATRAKGTWVPLLPGTLPLDGALRRKEKADLESLALVPAFPGAPHGAIFAITSGSAANRTKGAVIPIGADGLPGKATPLDLTALVNNLRARIPALNIEGSVVVGDSLRLLQRGGAMSDNVLIDLDLAGVLAAFSQGEPPGPDLIRKLTTIDLGALDGVKLGLSDASPLPDGRVVFIASAEDTSDPTKDGVVTGSIIGVMERDGTVTARFPVKNMKLEGVHVDVQADDLHLTLVNDADDEKVASNLMTVVLRGLAKTPTARETTTAFETAPAPKTETADAAAFTALATSSAARGPGWTTHQPDDE